MKYTITINQSGLVNAGILFKTDWIEWFIIDYLKDFVIYQKSKRVIYKNEEYTWLNYNHLIASLPCIKLNSKSAISKRISRLERLGLIKTLRAKDNTLYYTFTDKLIDICFARKKDIERLKRANPNISNTPSYPQLTDPVLRRETDPVRLKRTAQYNTKNTIINKDYNNDISFSSLKTKKIKKQINTDKHGENHVSQISNIKTTNVGQGFSIANRQSKPTSVKGLPYRAPKTCIQDIGSPYRAGSYREGLLYNHSNLRGKEIKGFSSFSNVWKVVENIRQRGLRNDYSDKRKMTANKETSSESVCSSPLSLDVTKN